MLMPCIQWSSRRKTVQLIVITLATAVPDFDSGIGQKSSPALCEHPFYLFCRSGIAGIFALAKQYDTTTGVINNLTSKYGFCLFWKSQEYHSDGISAGVYFL